MLLHDAGNIHHHCMFWLQVLKLLAVQVGKSYQQLLTSNMQYIYSHLVRFCDRPTFESRIAFLEAESRLSIGNILSMLQSG